MFDNIELQRLTEQWAYDRNILQYGKLTTQALKLVEEVGELCSDIVKGKDISDSIGDCITVLTLIAKLDGTDLNKCWNVAYNDIRYRKGTLTEDGIFIKDTQITIDFNGGEN